MAKQVTCPYCSKPIESNDIIRKYKQRSYHMSCYKSYIQELYRENDFELKDKNDLYDYIKILYKTEEVDPKIMAQIDKYYKEYELSYKRILLTLIYYFEIEQHDIMPQYGIGIIPYAYKDAGVFWNIINIANEVNSKIVAKTCITKKTIKLPKKTEEKPQLINIDDL